MTVTISLIANIFFFAFTLWLGAYLLARNYQKMTVRLTGLGIVFFAIVLALEIIAGQQPNGLLLLPALFWIGAALYIIPEEKNCSLNVRLKAMAVLHNGQKVTSSGSPPTVSLTISCHIRIWIG